VPAAQERPEFGAVPKVLRRLNKTPVDHHGVASVTTQSKPKRTHRQPEGQVSVIEKAMPPCLVELGRNGSKREHNQKEIESIEVHPRKPANSAAP